MDTLTLALRAGLSLACVLGLVWVLAKAARKHPLTRRSAPGHTDVPEVLARRQLSRAASVAVVRVGDRTLVLGVTDQQVTVLHTELPTEQPVPDDLSVPEGLLGAPGTDTTKELDPAKGPLAGSALSPATWSAAVEVLRERTVRR